MADSIRVGFPRLGKVGGPQIFLSRLKKSLSDNRLIVPRSAALPFYDIGLWSGISKMHYRKPYIIRLDGIYFGNQLNATINRNLNKRIEKSVINADGIIYQTHFDKKLISLYFKECNKPNAIIGNGTFLKPIKKKEELRRKLNLPLEKRLIITIADWRRSKRLPEMIDALRIMNKKNNKYGMIVIGSNCKIASEENIFLIGRIDSEKLHEYYQCADMYLHLSWLDHCPNTVIEAIANGVPVVCSNKGGTREIVAHANAGIISDCDEDADLTTVDLDNPPKPDYETLIKDVTLVVENDDKFREKIDREYVNIDRIAGLYADFIKEVWSSVSAKNSKNKHIIL